MGGETGSQASAREKESQRGRDVSDVLRGCEREESVHFGGEPRFRDPQLQADGCTRLLSSKGNFAGIAVANRRISFLRRSHVRNIGGTSYGILGRSGRFFLALWGRSRPWRTRPSPLFGSVVKPEYRLWQQLNSSGYFGTERARDPAVSAATERTIGLHLPHSEAIY